MFGELDKQLPITKQRFSSIRNVPSVSDSLRVQVTGAYGEQVTVTVGYSEYVMGKIDIYTVQCSFLSIQDISIMTITCETEIGCQCNRM